MTISPLISNIVQSNLALINSDADKLNRSSSGISLPQFNIQQYNELLSASIPVFDCEPLLLDLFTPLIVVGQLRGSIFDLFKIISRFGLPPTRSYLFLGNFIDGGEFSLETITFLYALKVVYPRNIYIIRGNHETEAHTKQRDFYKETHAVDPTGFLFQRFVESFSHLPIAALLFRSIFCVSSGISSQVRNIQDLLSIQKPIVNDTFPKICEFLISEPKADYAGFYQNGRKLCFGQYAFDVFMQENKISQLITGNCFTYDGFKYLFGNRLCSLVSCSSINERVNKCCIMAVFGGDDYKIIKLTSSPNIKRSQVNFAPSNSEIFKPRQQLQIMRLPKLVMESSTSRKTAMRILETSKDSIPSGHPILTLCNGGDKLSKISRIRTFATSRAELTIEHF